MEGISDIRITGIDAKRPPRIRKEPYIDLFFVLSHKVPADWADDFNQSMSKNRPPAWIKTDEGLYIETYVRTPDEVVAHLELLKKKVDACTQAYIAKILNRRTSDADARGAVREEGGEQGRLNRIIAGLDFGPSKA